MKKTILIGIGIIVFLGFIGLISQKTNKPTEKVTQSSTPTSNTPTAIIKESMATASPYTSKEEYGRGATSVSKKAIEAESLTDLVITLKAQNRYDEALEKLKEAGKLFLEAKSINEALKPPPQYRKSHDYYVKALDLNLEGIKLEIQATEHFISGEIELSNLEQKQVLYLMKEAISYTRLSTNAMP